MADCCLELWRISSEQLAHEQSVGQAGSLPLPIRTSEISAVKSSTPLLGTMMLLRRP
jgi:hypothetical protein